MLTLASTTYFRLEDLVSWLILGSVAVVGGVLGGAVVLAIVNARPTLAVVGRSVAFLVLLSLSFLLPYSADAFRARAFLARADSVQGVVEPLRSRTRKLQVRYVVRDSVLHINDERRSGTAHLKVSDPAWVFFDPTAPSRATIGRPGPDWQRARAHLRVVALVGGVLFFGYGLKANPAGMPPSWLRPFQVCRAILTTAAVANFGFAITLGLRGAWGDPRASVADAFWFFFMLGSLPSLVYTLTIGSLGWMVLLDRGLTSATAYAICGSVLGAVAGIAIAGPFGLLAFGIVGTLPALTFRALYSWGHRSASMPANKSPT